MAAPGRGPLAGDRSRGQRLDSPESPRPSPRSMRTGAHLAAALLAVVCSTFSALLLAGAAGAEGPTAGRDDQGVGYEDTPLLPGSPWRVHDKHRPVPALVAPGPAALPVAPPADALVLLGGADTSAWNQGGKPIAWKLEDGALVVSGGGSIETNQAFGDCQLHLEFATPNPPRGESQGRGNSGLFLMGRYELQILDSHENRTYADGQCGALYGQFPPRVNACRAPGEWQSYDVIFRAPRFEGERLVSPARITVLHNGVLIHDAQEFLGATQHRAVATYAAHAAELPLSLQDHGDPLRFRNIWIRRL